MKPFKSRKPLKKLQKKKPFVKHNFGYESFENKENPFYKNFWNEDKIKDLKQGYFDPNFTYDIHEEKASLVSFRYYFLIFREKFFLVIIMEQEKLK